MKNNYKFYKKWNKALINKAITNKQLSTITDLHRQTFNEFVKLCNAIDWNHDSIKTAINDACNSTGLKMGKFMPVVRTVLAGGITGPDMISFMTIIGLDEVRNRVNSIQIEENV